MPDLEKMTPEELVKEYGEWMLDCDCKTCAELLRSLRRERAMTKKANRGCIQITEEESMWHDGYAQAMADILAAAKEAEKGWGRLL